jgi:hypothetical protein
MAARRGELFRRCRDREKVGGVAEAVQNVTDENVTLAYGDQGYTGDQATSASIPYGIALQVVKLPKAKCGSALLPGAGWSNNHLAGQQGFAVWPTKPTLQPLQGYMS